MDTNNAAELDKELSELTVPGEAVVIDASELDYISSAGLRVFLKLKKNIKAEVTVTGVSAEVYDIFEVTGFDEILDVEKKMRSLEVNDSQVIGEGANGKVYRLDDETIVKVFSPEVPMEVVQEERDSSRAMGFLAESFDISPALDFKIKI